MEGEQIEEGQENAEEKSLEEAITGGEPKPAQDPEQPTPEGDRKNPPDPKDRTPEPGKDDDPEIDLGLDDKGQARKVKRSQILEWEKGHMLQADYTKKTQELSEQREQVKELFGILEHLKKNPKKAEKVIAILDEKEDALQDKNQDLKEQKDEIDELLKDLPDDDPYAVALRKQRATISAMQAENKKVLNDLQKRLDAYENGQAQRIESEGAEKAKAVLTDALDKTAAGLKFIDDEEKARWRKEVLTYILHNRKEINSEEEFRAFVKEAGEKVSKDMDVVGEKYVKHYLTKKGQPFEPSGPSKPKGQGSEKKEPAPQTGDELQTLLENELSNELKNSNNQT